MTHVVVLALVLTGHPANGSRILRRGGLPEHLNRNQLSISFERTQWATRTMHEDIRGIVIHA